MVQQIKNFVNTWHIFVLRLHTWRSTKVYNLAKCFWERSIRMKQNLCWIWFGPKEVEYTSEEKVIS
jgi:hypothetical protein